MWATASRKAQCPQTPRSGKCPSPARLLDMHCLLAWLLEETQMQDRICFPDSDPWSHQYLTYVIINHESCNWSAISTSSHKSSRYQQFLQSCFLRKPDAAWTKQARQKKPPALRFAAHQCCSLGQAPAPKQPHKPPALPGGKRITPGVHEKVDPALGYLKPRTDLQSAISQPFQRPFLGFQQDVSFLPLFVDARFWSVNSDPCISLITKDWINPGYISWSKVCPDMQCEQVFISTHTLASFKLGNQNTSARARADEDQDLCDDHFKCRLLSACSVRTDFDMIHYAVVTTLSSGQR